MTGVNTLAIFGNPEMLGKQSGKRPFWPNSDLVWLHCPTRGIAARLIQIYGNNYARQHGSPHVLPKPTYYPISPVYVRYGLPVYQHPPPTVETRVIR